MENLYLETIDVFKKKNKKYYEKELNDILYLIKLLIKYKYIKKFLINDFINDYIQKKENKLMILNPDSRVHANLIRHYQENIIKIKEIKAFDFVDNIDCLNLEKTIFDKITLLNNKYSLRLKDILNDYKISERDLILALSIIYDNEEFNNDYNKLKRYDDKQKTISDLEIILDNLKNNSHDIIRRLEIIEKNIKKKEENNRPIIFNINKRLKYNKEIRNLDNKIDNEIELFYKSLNSFNKENMILKTKYIYDKFDINSILEKITFNFRNKNYNFSLDQLINNLKREYVSAIVSTEKSINNLKNDIIEVYIDDKFKKQKIMDYIKNKRNNYIYYLNFLNTNDNDRKMLVISILHLLNIMINIDFIPNYVIKEILKNDIDYQLFETIVDDNIDNNNLMKKIEIQDLLLNNYDLEKIKQKTR